MRVTTSSVRCEQFFLMADTTVANGFTLPIYAWPHHQLQMVGATHGNVGRSPCHRVGEAAYERHKQNSIGQPAAEGVIPLNSGFHRSSDSTHNTREQDPWKGRARRIGTHHA